MTIGGFFRHAGCPARVAVYLCAGFLTGCSSFSAQPSQHPASPASQQKATGGGPTAAVRPRPEIPVDWPKGKRIVMHVTPSLQKSYVVACDVPVPALTYLQRGHQVLIAVDSEAVTAFRRDRDGKTPLDRLDLLEEDLDELSHMLGVPRSAVPKNFGELYRALSGKGIRVVASESALRALGVRPDELDPVVKVVGADEYRRIMTNLDALLPYDDTHPFESIFVHRPNHTSGGHPGTGGHATAGDHATPGGHTRSH